jgi:hypothetical protein
MAVGLAQPPAVLFGLTDWQLQHMNKEGRPQQATEREVTKRVNPSCNGKHVRLVQAVWQAQREKSTGVIPMTTKPTIV